MYTPVKAIALVAIPQPIALHYMQIAIMRVSLTSDERDPVHGIEIKVNAEAGAMAKSFQQIEQIDSIRVVEPNSIFCQGCGCYLGHSKCPHHSDSVAFLNNVIAASGIP